MKLCVRCETQKALADFPAKASSPDGVSSYCRECHKAYHAAWRAEKKRVKWGDGSNRKSGGRPVALAKVCTACKAEKSVSAFHKQANGVHGVNAVCGPCKNARSLAYRKTNPEAVADTKRRCYEKHAASVRAKQKAYDDANRIHVRRKNSRYATENPEIVRAHGGARRARVRRQTLPLTPAQWDEVVAIYAEADRLTRETGVEHVVDHFVPLKGETVCGLHVPWNLQAITAEANAKKFNKLPEDVDHTQEVRAKLEQWQAEKVLHNSIDT